MKHLRRDYDGVQDIAQVPHKPGDHYHYDNPEPTSIEPDEPVFLLRAKDALAPDAVRFYALEQRARGGSQLLVAALWAWANRMVDWQSEHLAAIKLGDVPPDQLRFDPATRTPTS